MKLKLFFLLLFSVAFALVEASVVFYLRNLIGFDGAYVIGRFKTLLDLKVIAFVSQEVPIFNNNYINQVEMAREIGTIIMLIAIAYLVGRDFKQRLGTFLIAFSVWDIFYYIFLKILTGWPKGFFDIDIFFLVPLPWVGPVITPLVISLLLLTAGLVLYLKSALDNF